MQRFTTLVALVVFALPSTSSYAQTSSGIVVTTDRTTGQDVVHYVPMTLVQRESSKDIIALYDPQSQYDQLIAYGRCVVAKDRDGSIAYVRAAASGDPARGFAPLRETSDRCRQTVAKGAMQLRRDALRVSAIAEALRPN